MSLSTEKVNPKLGESGAVRMGVKKTVSEVVPHCQDNKEGNPGMNGCLIAEILPCDSIAVIINYIKVIDVGRCKPE